MSRDYYCFATPGYRMAQDWCCRSLASICVFFMLGSTVRGQENGTQTEIEFEVQPSPGADGWSADYQSILFDTHWHDASVTTAQACNACHVGDDEQIAVLTGQAATQSASPHTGWLHHLGYSWGAQMGSLQIGAYFAHPLTDPVLRKHLRIGDQSALVIRMGNTDEDAIIENGDVILKIGEIDLSEPASVTNRLEKLDEDSTVEVKLVREGRSKTVSVSASELQKPKGPYQIGVRLGEIPPSLRAHVDLYENEGTLILQVIKDSPAEKAGLKVHDILLTAGDRRLASIDELSQVVQASKGEPVDFTLMRGGKEKTVSIKAKRAEVNTMSYFFVPQDYRQYLQSVHGQPLVEPSSAFYPRIMNYYREQAKPEAKNK